MLIDAGVYIILIMLATVALVELLGYAYMHKMLRFKLFVTQTSSPTVNAMALPLPQQPERANETTPLISEPKS